jgi:hypothetical protein
MWQSLLLIGALVFAGCAVAETVVPPVTLDAHPAAFNDSLHDGDTIGRMRLHGMLDLPDVDVGDVRLSQLSGLAWDDHDRILYALSDKGALFQLRPIIVNDTLVGIRLLKAARLRALGSDKPLRRWLSDAEGLDILNGRRDRRGDAELVISFEGVPRIWRYRPDGHAVSAYTLPAPLNDAKAYRDPNLMLESVCLDSELGILTAPEVPLRGERAGRTRIFDLTGKSWLYPLDRGNAISDMACLGDRNVLVLERSFGRLFGRNAIGLRRAKLPKQPSADEPVPVDTIAILDAAAGLAIDNFEGLTRYRGNYYFMVSDDNDNFFQRTLLLFFEILP